nr:EOG090X01SN [Eulimnadia texana]
MSFLRGSANYVWCTTSVLGKGATGAVFQGVNKHTGEAVAVKTFNQLSHMRPQEVQMREFEVLKKVKQENIVKLLAIEEEHDGKGKVIVMELCTGGSLFNILDDPENSCGLPEDEFLLVVEHLAAGMKHLRDNNLVHRDLKPGNIMKFIALDGSTVYKLTDFGAARELDDDQQFVSLYGTEEYLHPDMYERAVLRKPVGKTFGATVDLWSIGVTLYHVATGNLPFRPFGGRRNKETMYYITAKKMSGVISGVQTAENGEIHWSRELPDSCLLSNGIKKIVTPLFAGLMEVDPLKMWNFDRFFQEVTAILSRKPVHIFHVNSLLSLRAYVLPQHLYICLKFIKNLINLTLFCSSMDEIPRLINEQTGIDPNSQILLYRSVLWSEVESDGIPETDLNDPLVLFNKENNNVAYSKDSNMPKFPNFPSVVSVENDASVAKQCCGIGHIYKRKIEELARIHKLIHLSVNALIKFLNGQMEAIQSKSNRCQELSLGWSRQFHIWQQLHFVVKDILRNLSSTTSGEVSVASLDSFLQTAKTQYTEAANPMSSLNTSVQNLSSRVVREYFLTKEWTSATHSFSSLEGTPGKAQTYTTRLRESWQHLLRDRAARVLTYNDEQFHLLEKIKMSETFKSLEALLNTDCSPAVAVLAEAAADWYKMAQAVVLQAEILRKDVTALEIQWEETSRNQERYHVSYMAKLHETTETWKRSQSSADHDTGSKDSSRDGNDNRSAASSSGNSYDKIRVGKRLKAVEEEQSRVHKLLDENTSIMESLQRLMQMQLNLSLP